MCSSNFQDMGSGNYMLRGGLVLSNGAQGQHSNLPHRRYSVPETVMRKFTLSRERSSESCCDSEIATMPTPSASSTEMSGMPTDRSRLPTGAGSHPSRQRRKKNVTCVSKACQTSPNQSAVDLSSAEVRAPSTDSTRDDNKLPSTNLDLKQWEQNLKDDSNEDNSTKEVETSPEFFLDTSRESKIISEITLPGEVVLDEKRQSSMDVSVEDTNVGSNNYENISSETKLLLEKINQQELRKIYADMRSKSFADAEQDSNSLVTKGKRLIKSAKGRLIERTPSQDTQDIKDENENNNDTEMDSAVLEDDTPSPPPQTNNNSVPSNQQQNNHNHHHHHHHGQNGGSGGSSNHNNNYKSNGSPPKSGQSSESADCYITDCDICNAEGRKCCSLDDSSEVCSFTSPDIVMTTNELKTTSDFTSTSVTLCQTVSDRSSSTQDSTLSITSITPESFSASTNGKKKNGDMSPTNIGLVITSETAIIDPVDTRQTSKNSPFHLSDSSQSDNQSGASTAGIPLVLTSESVLIDPAEQDTTKKMHCVLEMMETDESSHTDNTQVENEANGGNVFVVPDAGEIFEDRSVDHRQSTGSIVTTPVRREMCSRSMSCGELPANYEGHSGDENDEGDLLKELGFKEEPKSGRTSVSFLELCGSSKRDPTYEETCRRKVNNMFYGNRVYEVMTSTTDNVSKKTLMGNVMSTSGDNLKNVSRMPQSDRQSVEVGVDLVRNNSEEKNEVMQHEVVCDGTCKDKQDNETICGNVIMLRLPLHQTEDGQVLSTLEGPEIENFGADLIIPRYSAKPRTSSMVVNTSSADYSSDSELSMADSLEEVPQSQEETGPSSSDQQGDSTSRSTNKHDERLVRGHVISLLPENNTKLVRQRTTEAYAYFVTLSGEMSEIRTESIPENLKKKLMERDSEVKKHSEHHVTKREKRYESIFKRPIARRTPKLSKLSKSEYHESFFKPNHYMDRRAYSLTSEDSEDVAVECKSTQWEENPESDMKNIQIQDEDEILEKTKESKWLKCKQLIRSTPELDRIVSEVILSTLLKDMKNDEEDEEIKDILLEALRENEELAALEFNEEQVVPSKEERQSMSDDDEEVVVEDGKFKCISVQTNESALHSILTCSYEACDICNEINLRNMVEKRDVAVGVERKSSKDQLKSKQKKNKENLQNNLKTDVRKMPNISSHHQRCFISGETNLLEQMGVNQKEEQKKMDQFKTPSPGRSALNVNYRPPTRNLNVPPSKSQVRLKMPISRRVGNLSSRFHQRFEAIPEERSGSLESGEEMKSPKESLPRRASAPTASDVLLLNTGGMNRKTSAPELDSLGSSSSSGNGRETIVIERGKRSITSMTAKSLESPESGELNTNSRRHTIHGSVDDLENRPGKATPTEKSRRHTVHGTIGLSSTGKINLNVGSIMKGRLIGKRGNVMIGRFHPVSPSEETQIEKDEKLLIGKIERVGRERHKGRDALATTPRGSEHSEEELLTLSKGWINFYLLRESMDIGGEEFVSDGEMSGSGSEDNGDEEQCTIRSVKNSHHTVTVVGDADPEDHVRQYTMQIHATEEQDPQTSVSPLHLPPSSRSDLETGQGHGSVKVNRLPNITSPTISSTSHASTCDYTQSAVSATSNLTVGPSLPLLHSSDAKRPILKHSKVRTSTTKQYVTNGHSKDGKFFSSPTQTESRVEYLQFPLSTLDNRSPSGDSLMTGSCDTESDSMSESPVLPSIRWPLRQVQQRNRYHQYNASVQRYQRTETKSACQLPPSSAQAPTVIGSQNGATCWTVTVTGNGGDPQQPPPDVEMRLSFANNTQKSIQAKHSNERTRSAASSLQQESKHKRLRRALQDRSPQPCWSLTVKNKNEEEQQEGKSEFPGVGGSGRHHTGPSSYSTSKPVFSRKDVRRLLAAREERERVGAAGVAGAKSRSRRHISPLSGPRSSKS